MAIKGRRPPHPGSLGSVVGGMLTKAGHDVTLIDRLSQRVQQGALTAQALVTLLG